MKHLSIYAKQTVVLVFTIATLLFTSCEEAFTPSDLYISNIEYSETHHSTVLDLPNGVIISPMPAYFDMNDPNTWTGGFAPYVNDNYMYSINYRVENDGGSRAFDAELDLHLVFDNGDVETQIIRLGDIGRNRSKSGFTEIFVTNKQLIDCTGEVFWFD